MSIEEILEYNPNLYKISFIVLEEILRDKFNLEFDRNKTWMEMGINDELDQIEFVIEIEKEIGIQIADDVIHPIFGLGKKPVDFTSYIRDNKIDQLGL